MKIITTPTVYLVGRQEENHGAIDRFLEDHDISGWETDAEDGAEVLIEIAGRVCYMSFAKPRPGGAEAYMNNILSSGHGSVLEHGVYNFIVTGISRSCSHELVRHRAGFGYSQLSQRYVDESVAEYVLPDGIHNDPELAMLWEHYISEAHRGYKILVERLTEKFANIEDKTLRRKAARQAARSVLPNATETKIFFTANVRALRHFIELRGTRHAEPEIRKVAIALMGLMQQEIPHIFNDFKLQELDDGSCEVVSQYKKV